MTNPNMYSMLSFDRVESYLLDIGCTELTFYLVSVFGQLVSYINKDINETKFIHLISVWPSELCCFIITDWTSNLVVIIWICNV
jgi:hypothetical protein